MFVLDPRTLDSALITNAHAGSKKQSMAWLGDQNMILTHGWSAYNERQYAVYDVRNIETPITCKKLDNQNLQAWIHYDASCQVAYVVNKGNSTTQFFYLHETGPEGTPWMQPIDQYKGNENTTGMYFLPKRCVDFMDNELNRAIRNTGKMAEYVSFKVPRKTGAFAEDLFPPAPSGESALTHEEWLAGENRPPVLAAFDPSEINQGESTLKRQVTF